MSGIGRGLAGLLAALCCMLATFSQAADKDFTMKVEPVFVGTSPGSDIPLIVNLTNAGPDAEGDVIVRVEGFQMRYPVQLPRGSKKKLTAYIHGLRDFEAIDVQLDTDEGGTSVRYQDPNFAGFQSHPLVMIADRAGQMSFLRVNRNEQEDPRMYQRGIISDAYIKPANAPERPLAYNELPGIVLGEGAERLSDSAIRAIRTWIMLGGTVIFVGGASAPILADVRWEGVLPVGPGPTKTISSPSLLANLGGSAVDEPVSVTAAEPLPGAKSVREAGVAVMVTRPVGLGRAVYLAFNPFEPPISRWTGRKKLFMNAIGVDHTANASAWLSMQGGIGQYAEYQYRYRYGNEEEVSGPFSATMPPTSTVVMLLLLYFLLVVPVNLLVLRLKGKGEWAWITTPIISLGFAGIFFAYAGSLYTAELSVAPKGILVLDSPAGSGYFIGDTQVFFPRGGSYDLKIDNLEYLAAKPAMDDYYYGGGGPERQKVETMRLMNPSDVGSIKVENMAVSNLSFHEFSFAQRVQDLPLVRANIKFRLKDGHFVASGEIMNTSPYSLANMQLIAGRYKCAIGFIAPGETKKVGDIHMNRMPDPPEYDERMPRYYREPQLSEFMGSRNVAMFGNIEGYRPGPRLGKLAEKETRLKTLIFLSNLTAPEAA